MKKFLIVWLLSLVLIISVFVVNRLLQTTTAKVWLMNTEMTEQFHEPVLGVFDRDKELLQPEVRKIQHYKLSLNGDRKWEIKDNLLKDIDDTIPILLTVEMWEMNALEKTARGEKDENIRNLFSGLIKDRKRIYIRWNPEMEVPANHNPWNNQPTDYIAAFRQFSKICKEIASHAQFIYGPSGYPGTLESYPGDDVVNALSITLNSDSESKMSLHKEKTVQDQIKRKLHRLRFVDKPVFILGSKNMEEASFEHNWIKGATDFLQKNKEIVYFENNFIRPKSDCSANEQEIRIGFYDPDLLLINEPAVSVEHLFISFRTIKSGAFENTIHEALSRNNDLIISVEPKKDVEKEDPAILKEIIAGEYDALLKKFFAALPKTDRTIYLRFAHEMEIPITRYPWQSQDPVVYIEAFRYFMQFPGSDSPNIVKIWGPAGDRGSLEWWPGGDVVDMLSIAIYGLPDKNITDPEKQESFEQIFRRKSWRLRFVDKPLFITEFGVKGDENFQTRWLKNAAETINKNPQIVGVSYFNKFDNPDVWGEGMKPPEWSISKNSFHAFLATLVRDPAGL